MKLTRAQRNEVEGALYHLRRARRYIEAQSTVVAVRKSMATTTLDFSRADGVCITEVTKEYGSDLCGLSDGIARLERFLEGPKVDA